MRENEPIRVLQIEDNEDDAELVRVELERSGFAVEWLRVETAEQLLAALVRAWDLIISDYEMPTFDGLAAFEIYKKQGIDTPFIFVSGALGEERAVEAMRAGARDYLMKGNLARLGVAVRRELAEAKNRESRRQLDIEREEERLRLEMAVEASGAGVFELRTAPQRRSHVAPACLAILDVHETEVPNLEGLWAWLHGRVHSDDADVLARASDALLACRQDRITVEVRLRQRDGTWADIGMFARAVARDSNGTITHLVGVLLDLRERRRLEAQLRQAQKMEAVGRLACGVAHDFNNLLTAIFSFGRFVLEELRTEDPVYRDMQEVLNAAQRAESLTAQLLAFSRRKPVSPRNVSLNTIVEDVDRMLRRIVGEDVEVAIHLDDVWTVRLDPGTFEQVVINLAVNARDAMPDGGKLTLETYNVTLEEAYGQDRAIDVPVGEYAVLAITDNGEGMDEATQSQIFEPFFTTKGTERGTGLGLSTCYGIVKQAGGYIWVYSEIGVGTTFKIYLPRVTSKADWVPKRLAPQPKRGTETILVAEDDEQVRRLAVRALGRLGYDVRSAANGGEALLACESLERPLHLLLTDVVMPEMNGQHLAKRLAALQPKAKVLYMSGYTENAVVHHGVLEEHVAMLQKPFTPDILAQRVREVLDADAYYINDEPRLAKILVIDDNPRVLRGTKVALGGAYDVTLANGGVAALGLLQSMTFDLVLCDILMPDMSGPDLYREVRATNPALAEQFIFVTGAVDDQLVSSFLQEVQRPAVAKPLVGEALHDLVKSALPARSGEPLN